MVFIEYLQKDHYFGVDKNFEFIEGEKIELQQNNLLFKNSVLKITKNFEFNSLN